ncbi:MAG: iron-containing alcohol dehydrogenase [Armatimonadetes bacterium]|nr:iron-containing alcohol dehydrogenase [Armatimonadota bacterium]
MVPQTFTFQVPTDVVFGPGSLARLPEVVAPFGERLLVVSDPGIAAAGILEKVAAQVQATGRRTEIVADVEPNPSVETVERATEAYRRSGAQWILAVGGGSAMDVGKAVALLAVHPGRIGAYEGVGKVPGPTAPLVCVPTTAGTGSEVTIFSVITDRQRKFKMPIGSSHLLPRAAVCDPDLTVSMPQALTAATGMDALTHAVECYTNTTYHPIAKALALDAIRLIGRNLRRAYANGRDLDARAQMLLASTMAAMAFTRTRLGNVHAMSHPVGAHFDVPHGLANALLLPYVMDWNLPGCLETFPAVAAALGEAPDGLPPRGAAAVAVDAVRQLNRDLGIPERLRDVGVTLESLPVLAQDAMKSGNVLVNPRATTYEEMRALFERAW